MSINYQQLPHQGIRGLHPYIPGKSVDELAGEKGISDIIKLASNENPLGCSPQVQRALANLSPSQIGQYPAPHSHVLKHLLSKRLNINEHQLTLSNGSDLLFTHLLMLFGLHTGKHMLTHDKAFVTYQIQAEILGVPVNITPIHANWEVDIDALINACNQDTGIIFLANPNNPTGLLIPEYKIQKLIKAIPASTVLVIDEAYYEYAYSPNAPGALSLLEAHNNLVITRTFSKAYGLAGLRLGYAIANPAISELLARIQLPFTVNQAALQAGVAALNDTAFLADTLRLNHEGMHQMQAGLSALNASYKTSACNFITLDCGKYCMSVYEQLLQQGIIVRPLAPYQLPEHLRVSIGNYKQNKRFLDTLANLYSNQKELVSHE